MQISRFRQTIAMTAVFLMLPSACTGARKVQAEATPIVPPAPAALDPRSIPECAAVTPRTGLDCYLVIRKVLQESEADKAAALKSWPKLP